MTDTPAPVVDTREALTKALVGHTGISFDLTTPRQYTQHGNWNQSCECGHLLGDDDEQVSIAWRMHLADVILGVVTTAEAHREQIARAYQAGRESQVPLEPDNHHNAAACPYCTPARDHERRSHPRRDQPMSDMPAPLDLPDAPEWGHITGRGDVAYYSKGLIEYPRRLVNRQVRIAGTLYVVNGVEMYAVADEHPANHWGPFGLCVRPVAADE